MESFSPEEQAFREEANITETRMLSKKKKNSIHIIRKPPEYTLP